MADIKTTQDISIKDEYNDYYAQVTSDGKLKVEANITASTSQQIQTKDSSGNSKDVGFETGNEQSVPSVIVDYSNPTNRLNIDSSGNLTANQGNPNTLANSWKVQVTDGTNTMPTMDSNTRRGYVQIGDGTNLVAVNTNNELRVQNNPLRGSNLSYGNVNVSNVTPTLILAANPNRKKFYIQVINNRTIYIGSTNGVTTTNGLNVPSTGGVISEEYYTGEVWGIAVGGISDVRYWEIS